MAVIDDLVAYYSLDEASGNAIDAHGTLDLTDENTVGAATGKVSGARDFERSNSERFVHTDDAAFSRGDTDFTFAMWVQFEGVANNQLVFSKNNGAFAREYALKMDDFNADKLTWLVSGNGSSDGTSAVWGTGASVATWYFVVVYHDSVNNVIGISVNDGTPVESAHSTGVFDGTADFHLGSRGDNTDHFDGLLDEFGLWGRLLTAAEITWLYNSGNGRSYADIEAEAGGGFVAFPRPRGMRAGMMALAGGSH